jgi:hypothetical protein
VCGDSSREVGTQASQEAPQAGSGKTLYRGMSTAPGGRPVVGQSARMLGARPRIDIPIDPSGSVHPGTGGMSVAPDTPRNLPRHRRPPQYDGTGKDPVWSLQERTLGPNLRYVPDDVPLHTHGVIEPAITMTFEDYQRALEETAPHWTRE